MRKFWCAGHQGLIKEDQVRDLGSVGRMCKVCGSGRVAPEREQKGSNSSEDTSKKEG